MEVIIGKELTTDILQLNGSLLLEIPWEAM